MKYNHLFYINILLIFGSMTFFFFGMYNLVSDIDKQQCSMTYMMENPEYKRHYPSVNASVYNKWYRLFHYVEGDRNTKLSGVPTLFVPGNSGSYKQVRSLASVSHQMSLQATGGRELFDYFTVDLNEELSALSATIIKRQVAYVEACLSYIASLYGHGRKVVIIGHSMGGLVARIVVGRAPDNVAVVVGLAAPMEIPLVGLDENMVALYRAVNEVWHHSDRTRSVVLVSLTGGSRDVLVWDGHGRVSSQKYSLWLPSFSVASVWASSDHLCITWCRQLIIAVNKALYSSLVTVHSLSPQDIISTLRDTLQPTLPTYRTTNISVSNYWSLLIRPTVINLAPGDARLKTLSLPALHSLSRPLRLKVVSRDCRSVSVINAVLFTPDSMHVHKYQLEHDARLLSVVDVSASQGPSFVQLTLQSHCGYTVTVYASTVDWAAQLIRIHATRMPAFISAAVILRHSHATQHLGPLSLGLVLATVWLAPMSGLSNDIAWLQAYTKVDIADLAALLLLSLILEWTLSVVSHVLTRLFHCTPAFVLPLTSTLLLPALALFSIVCPPLAYLALLLLHLLTASLPDGGLARAHCVTTVLLVTLIVKLPTFFAEYHSQIQHNDIGGVIREAVSRLSDFDSYSMPPATLVMAVTSVALRVMQGPRCPPTVLVTTSLWLTSVALASCCILFGAINSALCCSYLVGAVLLFEIFSRLSTVFTKV